MPGFFWSRLGEVDLPTLLLVGSKDRKFRTIALRMQGSLPRARTHVVEGAGHTIHLERPREWMEHVKSFLERGPAGGA